MKYISSQRKKVVIIVVSGRPNESTSNLKVSVDLAVDYAVTAAANVIAEIEISQVHVPMAIFSDSSGKISISRDGCVDPVISSRIATSTVWNSYPMLIKYQRKRKKSSSVLSQD